MSSATGDKNTKFFVRQKCLCCFRKSVTCSSLFTTKNKLISEYGERKEDYLKTSETVEKTQYFLV